MLVRIKTNISSFKTLEGDRFGDLLKFSKNPFFFSFKIGKIHRNKKVAELHSILACQISEHWN